MKKFIVLLSTAFLFSCNSGSKPQGDTTAADTTVTTQPTVTATEHNSKNSVDYIGTYKGTLPMASKGGMELTLVLSDSTYKRTIQNPDNSKPEILEGAYTWDETGSIISLSGAEDMNKFQVGENTLTTLDLEGKKMEGANAEYYILKKVQ